MFSQRLVSISVMAVVVAGLLAVVGQAMISTAQPAAAQPGWCYTSSVHHRIVTHCFGNRNVCETARSHDASHIESSCFKRK
jgi:hypothetical protein